MTTWQETEQLSRELRRMTSLGRSSALAVVTHIEGSTYRRPGAKLLLRDDATVMGQVSGGCLEADLAEIGLQVLANGTARRVHYDTSGPEDALWGFGLGCQGKIDVLVVPCVGAAFHDIWSRVEALLAGDEAFSLAWGLPDGPTFHPSPDTDVFWEHLDPPPTVVICGAGDDSLPLAAVAAQSGFRVTVLDHRPAYLTPQRFPEAKLVCARPDALLPFAVLPGTLVVFKTHSLEADQGWLDQFARAPVAYLGLMGPQARRQKLLANLAAPLPACVYGPVGLDVGAEGSAQIAVAIVAELLAVVSGRPAGHLRERALPIH